MPTVAPNTLNVTEVNDSFAAQRAKLVNEHHIDPHVVNSLSPISVADACDTFSSRDSSSPYDKASLLMKFSQIYGQGSQPVGSYVSEHAASASRRMSMVRS